MGQEILCPCVSRKRFCWVRRHVVCDHLIAFGFL